MNAGKRRKKSTKHKGQNATSDDGGKKPVSEEFLNLLARTKQAGLIFLYDDKYFHLLPASKIGPEKISERHDGEIKDKQRGKELLEPGMKVRLFWNIRFNKAKASVYAVGDDYKKMEKQFDELEEKRKSESKKINKAPTKGRRMQREEREQEMSGKRSRLLNQRVKPFHHKSLSPDTSGHEAEEEDNDFHSGQLRTKNHQPSSSMYKTLNESSPSADTISGVLSAGTMGYSRSLSRTNVSRSASPKSFRLITLSPSLSHHHNPSPLKERPESTLPKDDFEDEIYDPEDFTENEFNLSKENGQDSTSDTDNASSEEFSNSGAKGQLEDPKNLKVLSSVVTPFADRDQIRQWTEKRNFYRKKFLEMDKLLKRHGGGKERKPKVKVPEIKWKFDRGPHPDRERFQRLGKSAMWVDKKELRNIQEKSKHAAEYARKVMFKLLVTNDEIISLAGHKTHGIGFVKIFGKQNWSDFFDHIVAFRNKQEDSVGKKWKDEPPTEQELKIRFTSSFNNKIDYVLNPNKYAEEQAD